MPRTAYVELGGVRTDLGGCGGGLVRHNLARNADENAGSHPEPTFQPSFRGEAQYSRVRRQNRLVCAPVEVQDSPRHSALDETV